MSDLVHVDLDVPSDGAVGELDPHSVVALDKGETEWGGFEGVVGFNCILSLLDGVNVLVDGAVCADLVLVHQPDEV